MFARRIRPPGRVIQHPLDNGHDLPRLATIMVLYRPMTMNGEPVGNAAKAFYSIDEVAELLGLHRATVSGYISSGDLRAARLGYRTVRVTHEALMDFLHAKEEESRAALSQARSR